MMMMMITINANFHKNIIKDIQEINTKKYEFIITD